MTDLVPELLMERGERSLRLVLRAIIRSNPDQKGRTDEMRVVQATRVLLGQPPQRGAPGIWRDDLLEMMAIMYSIATRAQNREVSIQHLAEAVISMPQGPKHDREGAVVKDLVRKFIAHRVELLALHSFDGKESHDEFYQPIVDALDALRRAGINVDESIAPLEYVKGDKSDDFLR